MRYLQHIWFSLFVSCDPDFEGRKGSLIAAARSVCRIVVRRDSISKRELYSSGAAFFVGPRTLLTAGHVVNDSSDKIIVEAPGSLRTSFHVEPLFRAPQAEAHKGFECKLVKTLYRVPGNPNISK
jgi:hypothetical protein